MVERCKLGRFTKPEGGSAYLKLVPGMMGRCKNRVALSVIIPAYNEANRIGKTLNNVLAYSSAHFPSFEVIVEDDGSLDDTRRIVEGLQAKNPGLCLSSVRHNRGKGFSVREGVLASSGGLVLFMDADNSTDISEIEKLLPFMRSGHQVAIGSRALRSPEVELVQAIHRRFMGRTFNFFVKLLIMGEFRDTQCGFKCFTREAADRLFALQKIEGFGFDVELLYLAKREGMKIAEVPVNWYDSSESRVRPIVDSVKMLLDLAKIRLMHRGQDK